MVSVELIQLRFTSFDKRALPVPYGTDFVHERELSHVSTYMLLAAVRETIGSEPTLPQIVPAYLKMGLQKNPCCYKQSRVHGICLHVQMDSAQRVVLVPAQRPSCKQAAWDLIWTTRCCDPVSPAYIHPESPETEPCNYGRKHAHRLYV